MVHEHLHGKAGMLTLTVIHSSNIAANQTRDATNHCSIDVLTTNGGSMFC
eukprot:m.519304 g.519304  ORF g.519304 m.519304 type:complete len:50 (-) comp57488_c0_seq48:102-251(-)